MTAIIKFIGIRMNDGSYFSWHPSGDSKKLPCIGEFSCLRSPDYIIETDICYIPVCTSCLVRLQVLRNVLLMDTLGYKSFRIMNLEESAKFIRLTNQPNSA